MSDVVDEIDALAQNATARPWTAFNGGMSSLDPEAIERWRERSMDFARAHPRGCGEDPEGYAEREIASYGGGALLGESMRRADAAFAVALVNALPELIARLRRAEALVRSVLECDRLYGPPYPDVIGLPLDRLRRDVGHYKP